MKIQQSFIEKKPTLYLVATPIGNLEELSPRAVAILNQVDVIAAEDTRHTKKLTQHFQIKTPLIAHHAHNTEQSIKGLLEILGSDKSIALVSDAGYPLISDPGQELVAAVSDAGYPVVPVSGSSAFLNALVSSGLRVQPFLFYGFLGSNVSIIRKELEALKTVSCTLVFYVSVHKLEKTLALCLDILGPRPAVLARELTKQYETFYRGTLAELVQFDQIENRGEFVLMITGMDKQEDDLDEIALLSQYERYIGQGMTRKDAITTLVKETGAKKNQIYSLIHGSKSE